MSTISGVAQAAAESTENVEHGKPSGEPGEHEAGEHHHSLHLGLTGTAMGAFAGHESFAAVGGGLFVTWIAVPRRFELEVSARAHATEGGVELSQDVLGKVPFHVRPWFHPFIAIGPTVAEYFVGGETPGAANRRGWGIGGAVSLGSDFWVSRRVALVVEINYNLLYRWLSAENVTVGGLVNEVGGNAGVLFAF